MKQYAIILFLTGYINLSGQVSLDYYLDANNKYNPEIPKPESILGYQPGEWHVSHDKLLQYMYLLASKSDRITIENRGSTYEDRPLILLTVTDSKNHKNIDIIKQKHIALSNINSDKINTSEMPLVIYQGFSIHGNEASGANAGILAAYHLAASNSEETKKLLKNTIILFDPCYNPDGLQRFSQWANSNKNMSLNPDNQDREYNENWPQGRTNHYWFDLNRDWLPSQLPESKVRVKSFSEWLPNILTDHHEMGTNSTFFFQPGIPSRVNPLTPDMNQKLTKKISLYHADALNKIGSLYYSEEDYDDFYYGKGSTYPDVNGSIGILFEQASSRGHIQNSENGIITFPFTIRNQLTTIFSTWKAAYEMRTEILNYYRSFYDESRNLALKEKYNSIIFEAPKDPVRTYYLAEILKLHQIKIHKINSDINVNGKEYTNKNSILIPLDQKKIRLIKAMFNKQIKFKDSLFYDVSAWSFQHAFNVNFDYIRSKGIIGDEIIQLKYPRGNTEKKSEYAYLFEGYSYFTPRAIYSMLDKGLRIKIALKPFTIDNKSYNYGTYLVSVQNQPLKSEEIYNLINEIASTNSLNISGVTSGITEGIDLGSDLFKTIKKPKIGLIVGDGIRSYDAGEIWHLFDTKYNIPITKIDVDNINKSSLENYSHIILPSYSGNKIDSNKIQSYVENGGNLIAFRSSINWLNENKIIKIDFIENDLKPSKVSFDEKDNFYGAQLISGSIFETKLDLSHPINFGISNSKLPIFRNTTIFMKAEENLFDNPIRYSSKPLINGYISKPNLEILKKSVPFKIKNIGSGKILLFTDNTQFRAFWYGTNILMANAVFNINLM